MSTYSDAVLADAPIVYWRLGDSGSSAADFTGGGSTGTLAGTITTGLAGALLNDPDASMSFDGSTGQISVSDTSTLRLNQAAWSIEFWFYWNTMTGGTFPNIVSKGTGSSSGVGWQVYMDGSGGGCLFKRDNINVNSAPQKTFGIGAWNHAVWVYTGSDMLFYSQGQYVGHEAHTWANNTDTSSLVIGGTNKWPGKLDEIALYGSALSADRVAAHFNALAAPPSVPATVTFARGG